MGFYQFFIILICYLYLILLNAFTAESAGTTYQVSVNFTEQKYDKCLNPMKAPSPVPGAVSASSQCIAGRPYEKFKMQCYTGVELPQNLTIAWYRVGDAAKKEYVLIEKDNRVQPNKGDLYFTGLLQNDTNSYRCQVVQIGEEKKPSTDFGKFEVELQVLPFIKKMPKDVTAIEGEEIKLTCTVLSNVSTTVHWKLETLGVNKTYYKSEDRVILEDVNGTKNSILLIKPANQSLDRGSYACFAESDFGPAVNNATLYVRVKGKYAALIPFLGICGEVIVLCLIIFIYEKKRDKTELEESDTDQGPETKSSPDHGQDSVRYRK